MTQTRRRGVAVAGHPSPRSLCLRAPSCHRPGPGAAPQRAQVTRQGHPKPRLGVAGPEAGLGRWPGPLERLAKHRLPLWSPAGSPGEGLRKWGPNWQKILLSSNIKAHKACMDRDVLFLQKWNWITVCWLESFVCTIVKLLRLWCMYIVTVKIGQWVEVMEPISNSSCEEFVCFLILNWFLSKSLYSVACIFWLDQIRETVIYFSKPFKEISKSWKLRWNFGSWIFVSG